MTELFQMDSLLRQIYEQSVYIDLTLIDGDTVSIFNVGRQTFYMGDVGSNKAEVLVSRFNNFGGTHWKSINEYCDPQKMTFHDYDIVISEVDKAEFRIKLGEKFNNNQYRSDLLWLDVGNGKSDGQIILGNAYLNLSSNGIRLPNLYDLYSEMLKDVDDDSEDIPSCSTETALKNRISVLTELFQHRQHN
jgi:PRTRC genetic system ThiF family protein